MIRPVLVMLTAYIFNNFVAFKQGQDLLIALKKEIEKEKEKNKK